MKVVIIGNGVAGITTARGIANCEAVSDISLYTAEAYDYYPRPRLIDLIAGHQPPEAMAQYKDDWYETRGIETHLGCEAVQVDRKANQVAFASGHSVTYDKLVLATGARGWIPPIKGSARDGVYTLRTMHDALELRRRAQTAKNIVVIGGGLLGLDTSMALASGGAQVTIVEAQPWLLPRQLDRAGAAVLQRQIEASGAKVLTAGMCEEILGKEGVEAVQLKDGPTLPADLVVVSVGIRSNIALAQDCGLECNRGIVVNDRLQTTDPDIYAVGDCAEFAGRVWGIIPAALAQGRVAASQLCGKTDVLYEDIVPSTTLKVTGIDLTSLGEVNPTVGAFTETRYVDDDANLYRKLVIRQGKVVGAILLGDRADVRSANQLIQREIDISDTVDALLQPETDLAALVKARI